MPLSCQQESRRNEVRIDDKIALAVTLLPRQASIFVCPLLQAATKMDGVDVLRLTSWRVGAAREASAAMLAGNYGNA
jgi:hypothetical protein